MKHCRRCKRDLELDQFYRSRQTKDGLRSWCKECTRTDNRNHYAVFDSGGKLRNHRNNESRRLLKQQIVTMFGGKCMRCGYNEFVESLDFHHTDGAKKEHNIAYLLTVSKTSHDKLKDELAKCLLLCKNCHTAIHYGRFSQAIP